MLMLHDYRVRQRDFLLEIARAITTHLDLTEVLRRVLNASVVMLAGQVGLVALREEITGDYQIRATLGLDNAIIPQLNEELKALISSVEEGVDRTVLDAKMKTLLKLLARDLRQYVALPLTFAGEPLGLLIVFRAYSGTASPDDIQVLQSFADQAAIAVHNAQLYERIDHERKRLAAILQNSADGVMILDANLNVLMFNRAVERMTGWRAQDAIGRHQDDVIVWKRLDRDDLKTALLNGWPRQKEPARSTDKAAGKSVEIVLNTGVTPSSAAPETLYVEGDLERYDGLVISVGITYAPLLDRDGQLTSIIANMRDITHFRQAQELQNIFISTVSHELKTPVAIIKGYAGTLNRPDADWNPEVIHNGLEVIEDEADRLAALIENLLTASKIQTQHRLDLNLGEVQLDEVAARSVERFSPQTSAHKFKLNFPRGFPMVRGDEARLRQVLDNLISNAIKYSPDGGLVEVGGSSDGRRVTVYVRDQGVGMSEADQERLFERFYRADSALSRRTQGTGLGLYLSKAIVEAHGGTMDVESQPGKGSTFSLTLPLDLPQ